jgi:hypothetical protein
MVQLGEVVGDGDFPNLLERTAISTTSIIAG